MRPAVYRLFDMDGEAIYVGCSADVFGRMSQHRRHDDIEDQITEVRITYHATMEEALEMERREIARLRPKVNIRSANRVPIRPKAMQGESLSRVVQAITELGECDSAQVAAHLADKLPTSSVRTIMQRLRETGVVEVVGTRHSHGKGRPRFVVRMAERDATAA